MVNKVFWWICILHMCQGQSNDDSGALSIGEITGIVFGGLILIVIAGVVIIVVCLKVKWREIRRRQKETEKVNFKEKVETINKTQKSSRMIDTLVDRLPDISEEDENIRQSVQSVRDETNDTFQLNRSEASIYHQTCESCKLTTDIGDEEKANNFIDIITETNEILETDSLEKTTHVQVDEETIDRDQVTNVQVNVIRDITEDKSTELSITRVVECENVLRKDVPHLNYTENIFTGYDAAMTYKTESKVISKSDISLNIRDVNDIHREKQPVPFENTQDDCDLHVKSESKIVDAEKQDKPMKRSFRILTAAFKSRALKRRSSHISRISSNKPLEWNFDYISPYAMSEKLKQESIERKIRIQRRKKQLKVQKQVDKCKKQQENALAFKKWKQKKHEEAFDNFESADIRSIGSGKIKEKQVLA